MNRPDREPDFIWKVHEFWCEPEMTMWDGQLEGYAEIIDIKGILYYLHGNPRAPDLLRDEIQALYFVYIENKVEEILLTETESKNT